MFTFDARQRSGWNPGGFLPQSLSQRLSLLLLGFSAALSPAVRAAPAAADCPERLRVDFLDTAAEPHLLGDIRERPEPAGMLVDSLKHAIKTSGCAPQLTLGRVPNIRAAMRLKSGEADLFGGITRSNPFSADFALPPLRPGAPAMEQAAGEVSFSLYTKPPSKVLWREGKLSLPAGQVVGVSKGTGMEQIALRQGWPVDLAPNNESLIRKQSIGRTAAILLPDLLAQKLVADLGLHRLDPPVWREPFYVAASLDFQSRHPVFLNWIWTALCHRQAEQLGRAPACAEFRP